MTHSPEPQVDMEGIVAFDTQWSPTVVETHSRPLVGNQRPRQRNSMGTPPIHGQDLGGGPAKRRNSDVTTTDISESDGLAEVTLTTRVTTRPPPISKTLDPRSRHSKLASSFSTPPAEDSEVLPSPILKPPTTAMGDTRPSPQRNSPAAPERPSPASVDDQPEHIHIEKAKKSTPPPEIGTGALQAFMKRARHFVVKNPSGAYNDQDFPILLRGDRLYERYGGPTGPGVTFSPSPLRARNHLYLDYGNCPNMPLQPGEPAIVFVGFPETFTHPEASVFIKSGPMGINWEYAGEYRCTMRNASVEEFKGQTPKVLSF
ncbi:hypothetical protein DXG01_004361 [Tephrocybe rancida]|nr:hypothetical protein DXG01_004361 [Tephrocybe rancida]